MAVMEQVSHLRLPDLGLYNDKFVLFVNLQCLIYTYFAEKRGFIHWLEHIHNGVHLNLGCTMGDVRWAANVSSWKHAFLCSSLD